jgi:hypothetical protein
VHHADGDRSNNSPGNLVVCQDNAYHQLLHKRMRARETCGHADWLKCFVCKEYDDPANLNGRGDHRECRARYEYERRRQLSLTSALVALLAFVLPGHVRAQEGSAPEPYEVPEGAYRFHPPVFYREWHAEAVHCVGRDYYPSFSDVEWWAVPGKDGFGLYDGGPYAGFFDPRPDPDRIYLLAHDLENEGLVKHEITHHALSPDVGHPVPPFGFCSPAFYDAAPWRG